MWGTYMGAPVGMAQCPLSSLHESSDTDERHLMGTVAGRVAAVQAQDHSARSSLPPVLAAGSRRACFPNSRPWSVAPATSGDSTGLGRARSAVSKPVWSRGRSPVLREQGNCGTHAAWRLDYSRSIRSAARADPLTSPLGRWKAGVT